MVTLDASRPVAAEPRALTSLDIRPVVMAQQHGPLARDAEFSNPPLRNRFPNPSPDVWRPGSSSQPRLGTGRAACGRNAGR